MSERVRERGRKKDRDRRRETERDSRDLSLSFEILRIVQTV